MVTILFIISVELEMAWKIFAEWLEELEIWEDSIPKISSNTKKKTGTQGYLLTHDLQWKLLLWLMEKLNCYKTISTITPGTTITTVIIIIGLAM